MTGKIIARMKSADEPIEMTAMTFLACVSASLRNTLHDTNAPPNVDAMASRDTTKSGPGLIEPQWSKVPSDPN